MATFAYQAKNASGTTVSGTVSAGNRDEAQANLRRQNLSVMKLSEQKKSKGFDLNSLFGPPKAKVSTEDLAIFTRQMATMIGAGIPLLETLEILQEQAEDPGFKRVMGEIVDTVRGGSAYSEALAKHPKIFNRIYVSMIRAGEAGGQIDAILSRLAEYMEAAEALKREIKSAMTYPIVSLCMILGIVVGLMVFIVPKFKEIFLSMGIELPGPTVALLKTSDFMQNYFLHSLGGLVAIIVGLVYYKKTPMGARQFDWLSMRVPVFGDLFSKVAISRFARTFSTLLQSGVPILGALEIVADTAGNVLVEEAINKAKESVKRGETLGEPLSATGVFPLMVTRMISIGEKSGALEKLLEKISEFYDAQVEATVAALTSLIEPIMIGTMGLLVGGIVLAIFLPILKIQEALSKK